MTIRAAAGSRAEVAVRYAGEGQRSSASSRGRKIRELARQSRPLKRARLPNLM
jgi:hypothetical protein